MISGIEIPDPWSSKSPLELSAGCLWYTIDPVKDESKVVADLAITKVTSLPFTEVSSGEVTSSDWDKILKALTPLASNPAGIVLVIV